MKKKICIFIVMVLAVIFAVSTFFIAKYYIEGNKQTQIFESIEQTYTEPSDNNSAGNDLSVLFEQNNDLIGWLEIDGTDINYPVMNSDFYLKHNFNKEYSDYGVPFVLDGITDNTIIYGHNMKTHTMFYDLTRYADIDFYKQHKLIKFTTLESSNVYEIVYVFKTVAYSQNGFEYNKFSVFNSVDDFNCFNEKCSKFALYDTNAKAEYGDKLITLSTCEYSQNNGRFVVVAKLIPSEVFE